MYALGGLLFTNYDSKNKNVRKEKVQILVCRLL